jgi:hypothetical protein
MRFKVASNYSQRPFTISEKSCIIHTFANCEVMRFLCCCDDRRNQVSQNNYLCCMKKTLDFEGVNAIHFHIMTTSAFVIDGKIVIKGRVSSAEEIRQLLTK